MRTFVAQIFSESEQISQDVICYVLYDDGTQCDVEIKMPLYLNPSSIRDDVREPLKEAYGLRLNYLKYELAPTNEYIAH